MMKLSAYKYLITRRLVQISLLLLYIGANMFGWHILEGNLSSSLVLKTLPLSDPFAILQMAFAGIIAGFDALLGAMLITLFYALIAGRAFCSWICPINMITDLANGLRRYFRFDEAERKVWISRNVRYWIIGLSLILSTLFGVSAFEMVSPIGIITRGAIFGLGMGVALIIGVFLFDMFALKNGFCGHLCPLGGFYSLIGRFSLLRVHHNHNNCTHCMKCTDICPEKPVLSLIGKRSGAVSDIECTQCGRCIDVCNDNALKFDIRYIKKYKGV